MAASITLGILNSWFVNTEIISFLHAWTLRTEAGIKGSLDESDCLSLRCDAFAAIFSHEGTITQAYV